MIGLSLIIPAFLFLIGGYYFFTKGSQMHNLSGVVLTIAGVVYTLMTFLYLSDPTISLRELRYLDWMFTVPIMLYQLTKIANLSKFSTLYTLVSALCMLGVGFLGEIGEVDKMMATLIGSGFAVFTFLPLFNNIDYRVNEIMYLSLLGWFFYPLVYMFEDTNAIIYGFSIVDVAVKFGLSCFLYKKLI